MIKRGKKGSYCWVIPPEALHDREELPGEEGLRAMPPFHDLSHLDQWLSFAGGIVTTTPNTLWVLMAIYYTRRR